MDEKTLLERYVEGWKIGNAAEILSVLSDDCVIIESHGPTYRGKEKVKQWIADWHGRGNAVEKWTMTSFHICGEWVVFEWVFAFRSKKAKEAFDGITIAKVKNGKISELREYRSTAAPFPWHPPKQVI